VRARARRSARNPHNPRRSARSGIEYRAQADDTPDVTAFAEALETVYIGTVESGLMTRDLSVLIGKDTPWMNTQDCLAKLDENLKQAMR
jgi:isocitrate dehydrogenase